VVLEDRTALGKEGVVAAVMKLDKNGMIMAEPELTSRGFVFEKKYGEVLDSASHELGYMLQKKKIGNESAIKNFVNQFLEKYFYDKTHRRPMIIPVVVEV